MKRDWLAPLGAVGLLVLYTAVYVWQPGGQDRLVTISHVLYAAFALLAAALAMRAAFTFDRGRPQRRAWVFIGTGLVCWATAEILWAYCQIFRPVEVPSPSPADILWLVGYIPIVVGMVVYYRPLSMAANRRRKLIALTLYAVLLVTTLVLVVQPLIASPVSGTTLRSFANMLYPIADLCLALISTLSLLVLCGGLIGQPWRSVVISMLLFALADLLYAYGVGNQTYMVGRNLLSGIVDTAYLFGYVEAAMGGYRQVTLRVLPSDA